MAGKASVQTGRNQTLAAFGPASVQRGTSVFGAGAGKKSVLALAGSERWIVGGFHSKIPVFGVWKINNTAYQVN